MFYEIIPMVLISIIPGYLLTLLDKRLNDVERLALSFAVTFVLIGASGLALHMAGLPIWMSMLSIIPVVAVVLWKRPKFTFNLPRSLMLVLVAALLVRFALQFLFNYPIVGDSYFHMDLARTFTTDEWFEVNAIDNLFRGVEFPWPEEYRPPFFNFIMGFFFSIFGTSFEVAKLLNVVIGMMAIVPAYLIAKKYSNEKVAIMVSLFLALNPLIINQSMEAEVRIFTVYLGLASFYFFIKDRSHWMWSGALAGLLYITHYAPATILVVTYAIYFLLFDRKSIFTKSTFMLIISFSLVIFPWLVRNYMEFGDPMYTSSRYVYFATEFNQVMALDPPTKEGFISKIAGDPGNFLFTKATNIYRTFFPTPFQGSGDNIWLSLDPTKNFNVLLNPIGMIVTLPVMVLSFLYIWPRLRALNKEKNMMVVYIAVGILLGIMFWNFRAPFTHNFLFQQIFLISIAGFIMIQKLGPGNRKIIYALVVILLLVQIPVYKIRADAKHDFAQSWISENTQPDDIIMLRWTNVNIMNLYTERKIVSIPFEEENIVVDFARKNNVDYLVIDQLDLDTKKVSIDSLKQNLELVATYEIPRPDYDTDYTNTYWIFKV